MSYKYGSFNIEGTEFVINNPQTPRAFDNFLWNGALFSNIQQTGVGYCDYQIGKNEAVQLLTGNGRVCDFDIFGRDSLMSRLIYIRDNDTGEYWNVNWEPVRAEYEKYTCTHGLGYTKIDTTVKKINTKFSMLVPTACDGGVGTDPVELWDFTLANEDLKERNLSIFVYNQFQFRYKWGFDSYGDMLYRSSYFSKELNSVIASKHPHVKPHNYLTGFLTTDAAVSAYDGTREAFVGMYGTLREPRAVVEGHCSNTQGSSDATIGAIQIDLNIKSGEHVNMSFILGVVAEENEINPLREKYLGKYDYFLKLLQEQKKAMSEAFIVDTPDEHLNRMVNHWMKEQAMFGASFCRWGWSGYRDIAQHGYGVCSINPARTREIILEAISYQYKEGMAVRGWNPLDTKAYSDSALWLIFTLTAYIRETGDTDILSCKSAFLDSQEQESVLAHIEKALMFMETHKGTHGLCLIKFGDWNDSLTAVGKQGRGESVWLTQAYAEALRQMADLSDYLKQSEKSSDYRNRYQVVKDAINATAWDGNWYVRCFDDNGEAIGSHENAEGKIFSEAQGWALIADIADSERREKLLAACDDMLLTPKGYKLLAPTFTKRDERIGRITCLEPGICENGTIYSHINIWLILGLLRSGYGEKAYNIFKRITSGYQDDLGADKDKCPPYIYANCYYGPDHKNNAGQMEFTWVTGSIAWYINVMMNDLLGVRSKFDGLEISPCIPPEWKEYTVTKKFRGVTYIINIKNPNSLSSGEVSLSVDGTAIKGNMVFHDQIKEKSSNICHIEAIIF